MRPSVSERQTLCSTYTSGCNQEIPAEETFFLRGLQPSLPLQGENLLEPSMKLIGNSSLSVFEGKMIP